MSGKKKGYTELTPAQKETAFGMLLMTCKHGEPERGSFVRVAKEMERDAEGGRLMARLWKETRNKMLHILSAKGDLEGMDDLKLNKLPLSSFIKANVFASNKKGVVGRKKKHEKLFWTALPCLAHSGKQIEWRIGILRNEVRKKGVG